MGKIMTNETGQQIVQGLKTLATTSKNQYADDISKIYGKLEIINRDIQAIKLALRKLGASI